jgi:hypothetical protein
VERGWHFQPVADYTSTWIAKPSAVTLFVRAEIAASFLRQRFAIFGGIAHMQPVQSG